MTTPNEPTTMAQAVDLGVAAADADAGITPPEPSNDDAGTSGDEGAGDGDNGAPSGGDSSGTPSGDDVPNGDASAEGQPATDGADGEAADGGDEGGDSAEGGEGGEGKGGKKKDAAAADGKQPDPLNDPLPQGLKEATTKRIQDLIGIGKTQTARADRAEQQLSTIVTRVRDTGSSPEQYGQALQYLSLVNSGKREDILKALEFIEGERVALARMAGVAVTGVSFLGDYPDIAKDVKDGKITPERGEELAAQRAAQEHTQATQRHTDQLNAQRNAHQQAVRAAQNELNVEEARLLRDDPDYKAKRPLILKLVLPQIRSGKIKPADWLPEFKRIYALTPAPAKPSPSDAGRALAAARKPAGGGAPARQPLRANQPAGGAQKAPQTMAEAIEMGIQMGTR